MAILENGTSNYYKVDLADCFVQKNMVFASITVYGSESDRQIEKSRLNEFLLFDENNQTILQGLSTDEQNEELYTIFSKAVEFVNDKRYLKDGLILTEIMFPPEIMHLLLQCGYKPEWLSKPIYIVSKRLVNCGMYGGESFTAEYVYGKLKAKMTLDIQNI